MPLELVQVAGCEDFLKLTSQFERAVVGAVSPPVPEKVGQFGQQTGQFKTDVINAKLSNPPEHDRIFGLLNSFDDGAECIFLGGPDTIPEL